MNTLNLQQLNIINNEGVVVGSLFGQTDGMRLNFFDLEKPGEVIGSILSNAEGFTVQMRDAQKRTAELEATGLRLFSSDADNAEVVEFTVPKRARKAKA